VMRYGPWLVAALMLGGCSADLLEAGKAPELTPVGSGLSESAAAEVADRYPTAGEERGAWQGGEADYFRDRRASKPGDIITVEISIDDKAALNNTSNRSRKSATGADLGLTYDLFGVFTGDASGKGDVNSNSSSAGQGTTARSEKINLSVAAVVTGVLPNGSLVINGTQEVLVNFEARILSIGGIVNPRDVTSDHKVAYDKIAEARISYGGRGRLSEVQQPGWGQQIWDFVTPF